MPNPFCLECSGEGRINKCPICGTVKQIKHKKRSHSQVEQELWERHLARLETENEKYLIRTAEKMVICGMTTTGAKSVDKQLEELGVLNNPVMIAAMKKGYGI